MKRLTAEPLAEVEGHAPAEHARAQALDDAVGGVKPAGVARRERLALQDGRRVEEVEAVEAEGDAEVVDLDLFLDPHVQAGDGREAEVAERIRQLDAGAHRAPRVRYE